MYYPDIGSINNKKQCYMSAHDLGKLTFFKVLDDASSSGMIDDISTVIEVMEVVSTVIASIAMDVLQY